MPKKTLLLFTHPAFEKSQANRALLEGISDLEHVTVHDLYETYPDFHIDAAREQALLEEHDRIIWQHPLYWYSSPALLKEWFDIVLSYGWAFGSTGTALHGKSVKSVITTGSGKETFCPEGRNCHTIEEFLRPMQETARLCGMDYEKPLVFFQVLNWSPENQAEAVAAYRRCLTES